MRARSLLFLLLLAISGNARGQGNPDPFVREADRYFQQMAYARASELYRTAAELGAVNEHVTKRLAICSMKLGDMPEAERWYAVVVKFLNREPIDLYNYAEALKSNGRYEEAEVWMDRYLALQQSEGSERRSNIALFARKLQMDQDRFNVRRLSINTAGPDLAASWLGPQRVVFSSTRQGVGLIERRAAWNAQPFLDLFTADVTPAGDLANVAPLEGSVNTRFHEGPATASANGDAIWFTRNNYFKGRARRSQRGVSRLAIFRATRAGSGFGGEEQFLYNNSEVSIAHPALSPDGRRLYFASDMPGGQGGTDLYVCVMEDGQWTEPRNLGTAINTPFNESFPFIAADGSLFFASNGHPGLGGLDVMRATLGDDGRFSGALNLGAPVNSPRDDFAFIIDAAGKRGFFTSNRPGGPGDDDLFAFEMLAPLEERFLVTGRVIDDEHETPVPDVEVRLFDLDGGVDGTTMTDAKGEYTFSVRKNRSYRITAAMKGRYEGEQHLSTVGIERELIASRDLHLVADAGVWLLEFKEERDPPIPIGWLGRGPIGSNGERVYSGTLALLGSATSEADLGYVTWGGVSFQVRRVLRGRRDLDVAKLSERIASARYGNADLSNLATTLGRLVASGHARSGQASAIAAVLTASDGTGDAFVANLVQAVAIDQQRLERDLALFQSALAIRGPLLGARSN